MTGYIERVSGEIADILLREGIDYNQTKAVFTRTPHFLVLSRPREIHAGSLCPLASSVRERLNAGSRMS